MSATETITNHFASKKVEDLSLLSRKCSISLREQLAFVQEHTHALPNDISRNGLAPIADTQMHDGQEVQEKKFKVGIIGAGVAGMFTGMLFDYLKEKYKLDVEYEILETNDPKRVGGRLYTHYFGDEGPKKGNHDYYDVGAMRFPNSPVMKPTFKLFEELGMKPYTSSDPKVWEPEPGNLVPYYLGKEGDRTLHLFNDIQTAKFTPTAKDFEITGLPEYETNSTPGDLVSDEIQGFIDRIKRNPAAGWKHLMKVGDNKSVRQFFLDQLDFNSTEWLESFTYGTGWYDEALSEMILDEIAFDWPNDWYCVEGGSQQTAIRMLDRIRKGGVDRVHFNKTVTQIKRLVLTQEFPSKGHPMAVQVEGENEPRQYDAVFNSAPLGAMQRMDLKEVNLNWGTKQAIRALGYGASCKVGIRFKKMWWMAEEFGMSINQGGVSKTDMPLRVCVYPSYNIHDNPEEPGVLLCSYTWGADAQRIGTLIEKDSSDKDKEADLKALLLDNLAKLHANDKWPYEKLLLELQKLYDSHFAYDWFNDKGTSGAFAYFGPGQFNNMYPYIVRNDGTHIIIGEASSAHHAWVVGAIESAVRGVYQFLYVNSKHSKICDTILQDYNNEKVPEPWGPIPKEFDRTEDVKPLDPNTGEVLEKGSKLANGNGEWLRQGCWIEQVRLAQGKDRMDPAKVADDQVGEFKALVAH